MGWACSLKRFQIASAGLTEEKNSVNLFIASLLREHVICKHSPWVGWGRGLCGAKRPSLCYQDIPQHRGEKLQDLLQHWLSLFEQQWVRWSWKGTVTWQILCFMLLKKTVSLNKVFFRLWIMIWHCCCYFKNACGCKKGSKSGFTLFGKFFFYYTYEGIWQKYWQRWAPGCGIFSERSNILQKGKVRPLIRKYFMTCS